MINFLHFDKENVFARKCFRDFDISMLKEIDIEQYPISQRENLSEEEKQTVTNFQHTKRMLEIFEKDLHRISNSLELLTPYQLHFVNEIIKIIINDDSLVTFLVHPLTKKRKIVKNQKGTDWIIPNKEITNVDIFQHKGLTKNFLKMYYKHLKD